MTEEPVTIWSLDDAKKYHLHSHGLAEWMCKTFDPRLAVFDFGCGLGRYVKALTESGIAAIGFEATPGIQEIAVTDFILQWNIAQPIDPPRTTGTVICIEVMEHLLPDQEQIALSNLDNFCRDTVVLSWARPGQPGHGHNNCRDEQYIIGKMEALGFKLNAGSTIDARSHAIKYDPYLAFFEHSLYVFNRIRK